MSDGGAQASARAGTGTGAGASAGASAGPDDGPGGGGAPAPSDRRGDETLAAVAAQIRALRAERGLSLSALAAAAGVGKGSLSEIEHGARNPTLATLYALAGALGVPLATLLAERPGSEVSSEGVRARLLDAHHLPDGTAVEVYHLHLEPSADRTSPPHGPGVVEHLLVTAGRVRAGRRGAEAVVTVGDELRWVSDAEHSYRALDGAPVDAVLVIRTPPRRGERPATAGPVPAPTRRT
ncbi:helix-turn-helix domain-containing protein [Cellulosimicrobium sp. JZ28]|uniref:helix-turn-helix domain-containing protein n=1 Tax=Cellulosimicrobium sp. JZ28 TaxID=1906273 RepID=UPI001E31B1B7|nr:helix-turn-helix transcriptional regulator [Cellulosimicrobium sp. JZ28]